MADKPKCRDIIARAICQERCAAMGEPPCWQAVNNIDDVAWPNEGCDCNDLAIAAAEALEIANAP